MAEDVKAEEIVEQLRERFSESIASALRELPAHQALQLADALCLLQIETLSGLRVLYKAKPQVDGEAIAEDWRRGTPLAEIMKRHGCSKRTAYNYNPTKSRRSTSNTSLTGGCAAQEQNRDE